MKSVSSMSDLFDKLNDLKVVFSYGQRIIPVLQSLIDFMQDTVPLLETVNSSISESTSKMPEVSDQLNDVTSATEMATTEILNISDNISIELDTMQKQISEMETNQKNREEAYNILAEHLKDDEKGSELLKNINGFDSVSKKLEEFNSTISNINNNLFNITMALQVQDITSQQLAAVNNLISTVQNNLTSLLYDMDDNAVEELAAIKLEVKDEQTFNAKASYTKGASNQQIADDLLEGRNSAQASQDEIDKLFS